jgi:hypothetical protein
MRSARRTAFLLSLSLAAAPAAASTVTWDGEAGDGRWLNPLNWDGNQVPDPAAEVVVPAGSGAVHIDGPVTIARSVDLRGADVTLVVDSGATVVLDDGYIVGTTGGGGAGLTNHGLIRSGPSGLGAIGSTGTYVGSPRVMNGPSGVIENVFLLMGIRLDNEGTLRDLILGFTTAGTGSPLANNSGTMARCEIRLNSQSVSRRPTLNNTAEGTISEGTLQVGRPTDISSSYAGLLNNAGLIEGADVNIDDEFNNSGTLDLTGGSARIGCSSTRPYGLFTNTGTVIGTITRDCASWDGGGDGLSWSDAHNWSLDTAPAASDRVYLDGKAGQATNVNVDVDVTLTGFRTEMRGVEGGPLTVTVNAGRTLAFARAGTFGADVILRRMTLVNNGTLNNGAAGGSGRFITDFAFGAGSGVTFQNHGVFNNHGSYLNRANNTIHNAATINNLGGIDNQGTFVNECGAVVGGVINGNPIVQEPCDTTPPTIAATRDPAPNAAGWNRTDVLITFDCADGESGLAPGSPPVPQLVSTEGANQAVTASCTDLAGNTASVTVHVSIDKTPPLVACPPADGVWRPTDTSIPCSGADAPAGLVSTADASFLLVTAVPAGVETADACTSSRPVCDRADNCSTAGPVCGNAVDRKGPVVSISRPESVTYQLNEHVLSAYACTDGGSGVATCAGPVPSGGAIDTSSPGAQAFTVDAADQVGNTAALTVAYVVNAPPVVTAGGDATIAEGDRLARSGSFVDPDPNVWTVSVDYGDGSGLQPLPVSGQTFDLSHVYAQDGVYTVSVLVADGAGGSGSDTLTVTVLNVLPAIVGPVLDRTAVDEGGVLTIAGSFHDPGLLDAHTVSISWGDGATGPAVVSEVAPGGFHFSASHLYRDDVPTGTAMDLNDVVVTVTDDRGAAMAVGTVAVKNLPPAVMALWGPTEPLALGSATTLALDFIDPGVLDSHVCTFDWDDGTTDTADVAGGSHSCAGTHAYAAAGVYTIRVTVTDDDTGSGRSSFEYAVVYDPNAGFVTGGGWIHSPAGAYQPDPTLTGRANFGFNARYQKGAHVPSGQTEFQFRAGGFTFHSTQYDWLVVAGAKAQYKGSGTVNGAGDYAFLLTAKDGQMRGGDGTDRFRIKVWDKATDVVVYDNVRGGADDIDLTSPEAIAGGSIVIHSR